MRVRDAENGVLSKSGSSGRKEWGGEKDGKTRGFSLSQISACGTCTPFPVQLTGYILMRRIHVQNYQSNCHKANPKNG